MDFEQLQSQWKVEMERINNTVELQPNFNILERNIDNLNRGLRKRAVFNFLSLFLAISICSYELAHANDSLSTQLGFTLAIIMMVVGGFFEFRAHINPAIKNLSLYGYLIHERNLLKKQNFVITLSLNYGIPIAVAANILIIAGIWHKGYLNTGNVGIVIAVFAIIGPLAYWLVKKEKFLVHRLRQVLAEIETRIDDLEQEVDPTM